MSGTARRRKWSGTQAQERQRLAAERRKIRQEPSPVRRRALELTMSRKMIASKYLEREPELSASRWVAYGYLSALECTELFCRAYIDCYRHYYEKYRDALTAEEQRPMHAELLLNAPGEITSLWHARQHADELGMPYENYLSAVMEWATSQRSRKEFPRPNQLYRAEQVKAASDRWEKYQGVVALFDDSWDDRFFQQNSVLEPPRRKAIQIALKRAKDRPTSADRTFANLIGTFDALGEHQAEHFATKMFPGKPDLMRDARRLAGPPGKVRSVITFEPYLPPCLGMRDDVTSGACSKCAFVPLCQSARVVSTGMLHRQTGSSDPIAATKREQNRLRKRRQRDRDRVALGRDERALDAG